jgi:hypothetical protein
VVLLSGCAVRENRQINFSADATHLGFQHGREGVFVAGNGEGPRKIFTPAGDTLAVSSPLFSPTDNRLIFTTARRVGGEANTLTASGPPDPAGALYGPCPAVYTCWLRGRRGGEKPEALFEAACDHVGYIAANLAVRWHPKGDRLLFLDGGPDGRHGVFEFDLASKARKQVFPHRSQALIFDWAADKEHLVCVVGDDAKAGIWVGTPGPDGWWHVPGSKALAPGELNSRIEQLRATRPAWSAGGRFAFASWEAPGKDGRPGKHLLSTADLARRTVTRLAESDQPFRDLHWSKDGRLGVVQGTALRVVEGGNVGPPVASRPVRQFAGWSADGKHIAYVAHDRGLLGLKKGGRWDALLFVPDPLARDAVFVAPGSADSPGRETLAGLRVTFPHWSPAGEKLSLWGTFTPSHRSWLGAALGSALRPGDPAAVIDLSTGQLAWMPVSPAEKAQVGHFHLLKRDYAGAWGWYQQARLDDARVKRDREGPGLSAGDDFSFFESYALTKLGRQAEAAAKLGQSRKSFLLSPGALRIPPGLQVGGRSIEQWVQEFSNPGALSGQLLRDLYEGEVLLSLGAVGDAEAHFRAGMESAKNEEERLSRSVLLAQMLLAQGKWRQYARLTTSTLLPLAVKRYDPRKRDVLPRDFDSATLQQGVLVATAGLTLLPLSDREVLEGFADADLKNCLPLLEKAADKSTDSLTRRGAHMILYAAARRLGRDRERQKALGVLRNLDATLTEEAFDARARADLAEKQAMASQLIAWTGAR